MGETEEADVNSAFPRDEFSARITEQVFDIWIEPELVRRSPGAVDRGSVTKVIVVMSQHDPVLEIRLNDEAGISGQVRYRESKKYGDPVTAHDILDIEELWPDSVHDDAGWIAYVAFPDGRQYISFDLRRNRGAACALLDRAEEYFAAAGNLFSSSLLSPGVDCLQAAYELGIKALMGIYGGGMVKRSHGKNKRWIEEWARLGNVPSVHKQMVNVLMECRERVRYTPNAIDFSEQRTQELVAEVRTFLDHVRARASVRRVTRSRPDRPPERSGKGEPSPGPLGAP